MSRKLWLTAGAGLAGAYGGAAGAAQVSEVVVTAAPYAVSERSITSSANVLTREQLDVAPAVGLGDILNGQPGVRSTFFGPGASRPVIRGLSGPRVLILQNGVGQIDASDVSPDHAVASDPAEASRIEVLRGPSTLAYGGSGIGGVVNVLDDRVPSTPARSGVEGRASGSYASNGDAAAASGHVKIGDGPWVVELDGVRRHSGDYSAGGPTVSAQQEAAAGAKGAPGKTVANSSVDLREYGGGLSYVGRWGFAGASVRRTSTTYGVPFAQSTGVAPDEAPVAIHLRQTRFDLRGQVNSAFGPFEQVKFAGGHAAYEHYEADAATGEIGTRFKSRGEEGRIELVQRKRGGWQGAVGVQGLSKRFEVAGDEAFLPTTRTQQFAIFTLQRLDLERWGLEGGLRLEHVRVRAQEEGRSTSAAAQALGIDFAASPDSRRFTSYSASAAVFVRPSEPLFVSLNVAHNERAPTQAELFADGPHEGTNAYEIGDPNVSKEKVYSVEGVARYTTGRATLEAHFYHARYRGFLQETPTGGLVDGLPVQQFRQVGARFYGAEAMAGWDAWSDGRNRVRLEATYDIVRGKTDEGPAPRVPPYSATGRAMFENARLTLRAECRYVARQDRVVAYEAPTDSYTLVNLFVSYRPAADQDLRLFVEAQNVGDVVAREHASFLKAFAPLPGGNVRAGFAYAF